MSDINFRIKELFNVLGLSQSDFARKINVTPAYVWKLINKPESIPSDRVMDDICQKFNVNYEWLRTGEGEMFKELFPEDETAALVSDLLEDGNNPLYDIIKDIMRTYAELDTKSQEVIRDFSVKLRENMGKKKGS